MLRNLIILPDGTELYSGTPGSAALTAVTLTECVNSEQDLRVGCVCATMLEAEILIPEESWSITAGQELTLYQVAEDGSRVQVGIFIAEKPERVQANIYRLTAYDRVSLLDRDLTTWLAGLDRWPYDLRSFGQMVCQQCGVELIAPDVPNGSYQIQSFTASGVTGRQLMKWIAEISGQFCRATAQGALELAWYQDRAITVKPTAYSAAVFENDQDLSIIDNSIAVQMPVEGSLAVTSQQLSVSDDDAGNVVVTVWNRDKLFYYRGSLTAADYTVRQVEKVHLKQTEDDTGIVYPDLEAAVNTYTVSENYLLTGNTAQTYKQVAQTLYERLAAVQYTPCTLSLPAGSGIRAGDILQVTDGNGKALCMYVMLRTQKGGKDQLKCTGEPCRDSTTTVNNSVHGALPGKILTLQKDMEGLRLENRQTDEKLAKMSLAVDGITTQVQHNETQAAAVTQRISALEQTAQDVTIRIQTIQNDGVSKVTTATGYTFAEDGLHISKDGQEMQNHLDHEGMVVSRGGDVLLKVTTKGVEAADVTVKNYLIAGGHARFEVFGDTDERTACYYV